MFLEIFWLFSIQWATGLCKYAKPIPEKINNDLCFRQPYLLNDCNWCRCTPAKRYTCDARDCDAGGVDMFKHFKENVQPMNVGMEQYGAWRSKEGFICEPNARYSKNDVVCVCNEEGSWPNPVCDNLFSLLYSIKITGIASPKNTTKCEPKDIYLIGCNACLCPNSGFIDPELCTLKKCTKDDPALLANKGDPIALNATRRSMTQFQTIYIECNPDQHYKLGCRSCVCSNDNKLICGQCLTEKRLTKSKILCYGHHHYIFADDCNICYCGDGNFAFCTVKKCLTEREGLAVEKSFGSSGTLSIDYVKPPDHDKDCVLGTIYKRDCNICYCVEIEGVKIIDCKMEDCEDKENPLKSITSSCVPKTYYELNCLLCHCIEIDKDTWQRCAVKEECESKNPPIKAIAPVDDEENIESQITKNETAESQTGKSQLDIKLDVIRMVNPGGLKCAPKTWYKVDCNFCMCLENGNTLCTFFDCK